MACSDRPARHWVLSRKIPTLSVDWMREKKAEPAGPALPATLVLRRPPGCRTALDAAHDPCVERDALILGQGLDPLLERPRYTDVDGRTRYRLRPWPRAARRTPTRRTAQSRRPGPSGSASSRVMTSNSGLKSQSVGSVTTAKPPGVLYKSPIRLFGSLPAAQWSPTCQVLRATSVAVSVL